MLAEAVAEVSVAGETNFDGYLHDALLRLFQEQLGGMLQTQLLDIGAHLGVLAALGEDGADSSAHRFLTDNTGYKAL